MKRSFGYWFSGLVDGEGTFNILLHKSGPVPCFKLALRVDDGFLIELIKMQLGFGKIYYYHHTSKGRNNNPQVIFQTSKKLELQRLVELFRKYPLRSKKQEDFRIWAEAVRAYQTGNVHGNRWTGPRNTIRNKTLLSLKQNLEFHRRFKEAA